MKSKVRSIPDLHKRLEYRPCPNESIGRQGYKKCSSFVLMLLGKLAATSLSRVTTPVARKWHRLAHISFLCFRQYGYPNSTPRPLSLMHIQSPQTPFSPEPSKLILLSPVWHSSPPPCPMLLWWCLIIIMGMLTLIEHLFILCQVLHMSFHLNASNLISESCLRQIIRKQNQYSGPVCLLPQPDHFTIALYLEGSENARPTYSVSVMEIIA